VKRTEKEAAVAQMSQLFQESPHLFLAGYRGLTVNQASELRDKIRSAGGRYQVVKNRLAKRAMQGTPAEPLSDKFDGPCGVATHDSDPVILAKALAEFAKDHKEQIRLLAGLVDAKDLIDAAGVQELSKLPGLPELRAQLLAMFQTPATQLVRLLGTPATQLARVVDARVEAEGGAEAPAAEAEEEAKPSEDAANEAAADD